LLLEAGGAGGAKEIRIPAAFSKLFKTGVDWNFATEPEPNLHNRRLYWPRGKVLGGSSAINAMIYIRGNRADYDSWRDLGNAGWGFAEVLPYFKKSENQERGASEYHGVGGPVNVADPRYVNPLTRAFLAAAEEIGIASNADFNGAAQDGAALYQVTQKNGGRWSAADGYLQPSRARRNLTVVTGAHATRVMMEGKRAVGVAFLRGGAIEEARADSEVILAGGTVHSPQLLMLSGIGPRTGLESFGIPVRVELPGVGNNLQDRYEVGMVHRMNFERWEILKGATFGRGDPLYREWADKREGVYTSNGAVLASILKSQPERPLPDLFCFALLGLFGGYFPGYSALEVTKPNYLTWAILKAHTQNRAGEVVLRSADPRDTPLINFHYFEEGSDTEGEDLRSVVAGIRFVRRLTAKLKAQRLIAEEEQPGETLQTDAELMDFVRSVAWGHHASCTCAIGPQEGGGVLGSDFRVHGTEGLRVVDASVFPRIPGFFIASAVYMVAEKAADVILAS